MLNEIFIKTDPFLESVTVLLLRDDLIELCGSYKNRGPDSKFAHSEVFKVLSEEGAAEARRICLELKKYAVQDQRNCKLRSDSLEACQVSRRSVISQSDRLGL